MTLLHGRLRNTYPICTKSFLTVPLSFKCHHTLVFVPWKPHQGNTRHGNTSTFEFVLRQDKLRCLYFIILSCWSRVRIVLHDSILWLLRSYIWSENKKKYVRSHTKIDPMHPTGNSVIVLHMFPFELILRWTWLTIVRYLYIHACVYIV